MLCYPPNGSVYFGAFPPIEFPLTEFDITESSIKSFGDTVGKPPAIVYFSHEWSLNRKFPIELATSIRDTGAVPYVRLMLRSSDEQYIVEPQYTLKNIVEGKFDHDLKNWAREARYFGSPLIVEYGTEVNGWWFPWNGYWNGKEKGSDWFISAYRHIIDVMRAEGAWNIIWVYHINDHNNPNETWNSIEAYYPGDSYIDWVGVSIYGVQSPLESAVGPFTDRMDQIYADLNKINLTKPIIISEIGTDVRSPYLDPVTWTEGALVNLTGGRWPTVFAFLWWDDAWPNNNNPLLNTTMHIKDNPEMTRLFRSLIGQKDKVLGHVGCQ